MLISLDIWKNTRTSRLLEIDIGQVFSRLGMSVTTQGGSGRQFVTGP